MKNHLLSILSVFSVRRRFIQGLVMLTIAIFSVVQAQGLPAATRVSVSNSGLESNDASFEPAIFADSRYFVSELIGDTGSRVRSLQKLDGMTFKSISKRPSKGWATFSRDIKEIKWQKNNAQVSDSVIARARAMPENKNQFALGIQMRGQKSDYSLVLSSPVTTNSLGVYFENNQSGTDAYLKVESMKDGKHNSETFFVTSVMGKVELGVNAGVISVKLNNTLYTAGFSSPDLGATTDGWFIDVEIKQGLDSSASGMVTARLISDSTQGLTLPTSEWLSK